MRADRAGGMGHTVPYQKAYTSEYAIFMESTAANFSGSDKRGRTVHSVLNGPSGSLLSLPLLFDLSSKGVDDLLLQRLFN